MLKPKKTLRPTVPDKQKSSLRPDAKLPRSKKPEVIPVSHPCLAIQSDGLQVPLPGAVTVAVRTTGGLLRLSASEDGSSARIDTPDGYIVLVPHAQNVVVMFVRR